MNPSRILIIEDEAVVAMDIRRRLDLLGYQVAGVAASGEEAVALATAQRPDLVLMDIRLQGAMDGITAAERISQLCHLPVVFLTAYAEDATLQRAKLAEPFGYILKPFEDRELKTIIEIAIYKHGAEEEIRRLNRLYAVLSQVNQAIVRVGSRDELLPAICRVAVEHGGFKLAWISWLDPAARTVRPVAQWGDEHGHLRQLMVSVADEPQGQGPTSRAIHEGRTCVCNDLVNDSRLVRWRESAADLGIRAVAAVPICFQGEVCGAFGVGAAEPDFFREKEIRLLEEVALDVASALDNLEKEARRRQAEVALRKSEQKYRDLVENANSIILRIDPEGRITFFNEFAEAFFGYTEEEVLGRNVVGTIVPETDSAGSPDAQHGKTNGDRPF